MAALGQELPKTYTYNVPAQEMAKHRAKFAWLALSDVAVVTKPCAKPVEICWGAPN